MAATATATVNTAVTLGNGSAGSGNLSGPGTLTVAGLSATVGQGSLTLNGNDSTYTAGITLNGGSLVPWSN